MIQGLVVLMAPPFYAVLPAMIILSYRVVDVLLMTAGITRNRFLDGVIMGKFTGQIPSRDGVYANQPSNENVVAFQLITRSNQYVSADSASFSIYSPSTQPARRLCPGSAGNRQPGEGYVLCIETGPRKIRL